MGISHLSILGGYANADIVGVCDTSKMVTDFLTKQGNFNCFGDYKKMIDQVKPDAVVVVVPTKFHYSIIKDLLEKNIHVFAEKPFCLNYEQSEELVKLAAKYNEVIDRESALEILNKKIKEHQEERAKENEEVSKPKKEEKSTVEKVLTSTTARQVGRTVAREVARGLLGVLGIGSTRRKKKTSWF